jgi:threonine/homoserine/homoserine lactone efflux protein
VFVLMTAVWLCSYALVAVEATGLLRRRRVSTAIDRLSGVILIGFGCAWRSSAADQQAIQHGQRDTRRSAGRE